MIEGEASGKPILCVGQIVADVVVRPVDRLPFPGRLDVLEDLQLVPGGCACNTACVLAKLGASARIAGLVGEDPLGDAILSQVSRTGVDMTFLTRSREVATTAVVVVVASDGQRSFLYRGGGNEGFTDAMVTDAALASCGIVHVGGAMKLIQLDLPTLLGRAKAAGCRTSMDTDWDPAGRWRELIGPALPFLDDFFTNEEEGHQISGREGAADIAAALLDMGPSQVIVKMGERGSLLAHRESVSEFPAFQVRAVDTTCAGDAFVAGFLFGAGAGWPAADSMILGNAAGALCTTRISHAGVEALAPTLAFIRAHRELYPDFDPGR